MLETRKNSLYLNFITDISSNILLINDSQSEQFVQKYVDLFSEIQGKFLNLFNQEMTFYAKYHQQEQKAVTIKDFINKNIVKNMIEIINVQIMLKLISF